MNVERLGVLVSWTCAIVMAVVHTYFCLFQLLRHGIAVMQARVSSWEAMGLWHYVRVGVEDK
ncbi:hypothetical protein RSAG8_10454, partial [Rhizoctonia solani AG-8 WAC10335]